MKKPHYTVYRKLGWTQGWSGWCCEGNIFCPIWVQTPKLPAFQEILHP